MSFYKKQVTHCMRGDYDEWRNIKHYTTFDVIDKECIPEIGDKHGSEVLIAIDELEVDPDDQIKEREQDYRYLRLTYKETNPVNEEDDLISREYVAYDYPIEETAPEKQLGLFLARPAIRKITDEEVRIKVNGEMFNVPRSQFVLLRRHRGFVVPNDELMKNSKLKECFKYYNKEVIR